MSKERHKALKPKTASSLPHALSTGSDQKWRRLARLRNGFLLCFLVSLVGVCFIFFVVSPRVCPPPKSWLASATYALSACWAVSNVLGLLFHSLLGKHARRTLQSRDITDLGCWIHQLLGLDGPSANTPEERKCNAEMRTALLEQLPLLTEETAFLLRPGDRNTLYRTLYKLDEEIIAVVLQVIPILGDARALRGVQHLADGKGAAGKHPELQTAAQSSLSRLQARLALSSSSQGLLRASQPPPMPPEELLLPAQANTETTPSELLRADPRK